MPLNLQQCSTPGFHFQQSSNSDCKWTVYHEPGCPDCSSLHILPPNGHNYVSAIIHPEVFLKDLWIFRTCGQEPIEFVEKYLNCSHKLTCALREGGAAIPSASLQSTLPSGATSCSLSHSSCPLPTANKLPVPKHGRDTHDSRQVTTHDQNALLP